MAQTRQKIVGVCIVPKNRTTFPRFKTQIICDCRKLFEITYPGIYHILSVQGRKRQYFEERAVVYHVQNLNGQMSRVRLFPMNKTHVQFSKSTQQYFLCITALDGSKHPYLHDSTACDIVVSFLHEPNTPYEMTNDQIEV